MKKEELSRLRKLQMEIKSQYEVLTETKQQAYRITQLITGLPKGHNGDGLSGAVIKVMAMAEMIEESMKSSIEEYTQKYEQAAKEIKQIPNTQERAILELRYLAFKSWYEIAKLMHLSERQVYRMHKGTVEKYFSKDVSKCQSMSVNVS